MQKELKLLAGQMGRFAIVGAVATAVHIAVAETLLHTILQNPQGANVAAFGTAVLVSFFGHYHWSFRSQADKGDAFLRFFAVALLAMVANNALLKVLLGLGWFIPDVSIVLAAMAVPVISFILSRVWAFAEKYEPSQQRAARRKNEGNAPLVFLCWLAITCALLFPLLFVDHPQAVDLANHLARQYTGHMLAQSPVLSRMYDFQWMLFPYLAFDVPVAALLDTFTIYDTGRIVMGIVFILWMIVPMALYRALWGRWSLWPLLAALVVYNGNTVWGFSSYSLAAAGAALAFTGWVTTENMRLLPRLLLFGVISFLVYCGHLMAFAILGALIGGYELSKLMEAGKVAPKALFKSALMLAPLFLPGALHFLYTTLKTPPLQRLETLMPSFQDRAMAIVSPFYTGIETANGHTTNSVSLASLCLMAQLFAFLATKKCITVHKRLVLPLLLLTAIALVMPPKVLGISFTHYRLPFLIVSVLIASSKVEWEDRKRQALLAVLFIAALGFRIYDTTRIWQGYDAHVKEFIAKIQIIQPGQKVLVVNRDEEVPFTEHYHTGSFLTIERQAFIPNLFTVMHFFAPKGDYARLAHPTATHPISALAMKYALDKDPVVMQDNAAYFRTWWKDFDYVIAYQPAAGGVFFPKYLEPVSDGSFFGIYKVKPESQQAKKPKPAKTHSKHK